MARLEAVIDRSGVADRIEAFLPVGIRPRQLSVRTLLLGILFALADGRPAHLTRVHTALTALPADDRRRLGVTVDWRDGAHTLTYRQVEYTFARVVTALGNDANDGAPSTTLAEIVDALLEATIPPAVADTSTAVAVDWSDVESFAKAPLTDGGPTADPDASWGHRRGDGPGERHQLFYGYYLSAATMVREETGPTIPELVRRVGLTACAVDPAQAIVPILERLHHTGVVVGDVLADSGYAHRTAQHFMAPLRQIGAQLVMDLHPSDRGPKGTHQGAVACNGNLYCPCTPRRLLELAPAARAATPDELAAHDTATAETGRYKLGRITTNDGDGYHRVCCPAVMGKLRCPLRPDSMNAPHSRPEILDPPEHPPACCTQKTITVPPAVNAKTGQKHDYPSTAWRRSYTRRTAVERSYSTVKDPASNDVSRGWCRVMGLTAMTILITCVFVVRNLRVLDAYDARVAEDQRRAAAGKPPKTRRRRRTTLNHLITVSPP